MGTIFFDFSLDALDHVLKELSTAREYIRIALFQIHSQDIFEVLLEKLNIGVSVEIFTLPYDSINPEIRSEVIPRFENLKRNGAKMYFCAWNVGDPERTVSAVGRWYSFHGKFIVTELAAISLSANFTLSRELDTIMIYKGDRSKIMEFNNKFDELLKLFITQHDAYDGNIRGRIIDVMQGDSNSIFSLPRIIESTTHSRHWIRHYPASLCPETVTLADKLYIIPFDIRGRKLFEAILGEATSFIYISTESFTDPAFPDLLIRIRLKGLDIKILTGATSMDYQERIQVTLREMLAQDIELRTTTSDLHAKLFVTDRRVVISSINLNRINLGFNVT